LSSVFSGFSVGQISTRPGAAFGNAMCGGMPASSVVTLTKISRDLNTVSTAASTFGPERNEWLNRT
jgi:hypothetical protein